MMALLRTKNGGLFYDHTYCIFLISHNSIIDVTDFSISKYDAVLSYFDGYEIQIYTKDLMLISRRYKNPAHEGDYITQDNLDEWLKACKAKSPHGTSSEVTFTREVEFKSIEELLAKNVAFCKNCKHCKEWGFCHRN